MNYSQFLSMLPEMSLMTIYILIFIFDLVATGRYRRLFHLLTCVLILGHIMVCMSADEDITLFGGMYHSNAMISFIKAMLTFGSLLIILQANKWLRSATTYYKQGEFYILLLSTLTGMYFMLSARHFLLLYIGIELASLPLACLVAFDKYRHNSAEAGIKYILTSMFSSAVMLYGISFLYGTTGTLYFDGMTSLLTAASGLQIYALVMFFAGMGFKISLVPFHLWTADSYQGAPTVVTAYLSVISKGSAVCTLFIVLNKVFANMVLQWQSIIAIVTVASITIANLMAIKQSNLKRFMAFSSISQAGYIMLALIGGTSDGMASLVYYVLVYIVANLAVFGIIEAVEHQCKLNMSREDCNALYSSNPRLALLMMLALFSLAGIPPFAGFFSKFFVFMTAFRAGFRIILFIALVNTVISLYYYLLIVKAMFIEKSDNPLPAIKCDVFTRASLSVCFIGILLFGVCSVVYGYINSLASGI